MTEEEIKVKVAEFCGWTDIAFNGLYDQYEGLRPGGVPRNRNDWLPLPDYTTDLNAMHEAEKLLRPEQWRTYSDKLMNEVLLADPSVFGQHVEARYRTAHCSARQKAGAILRTIGQWKD